MDPKRVTANRKYISSLLKIILITTVAVLFALIGLSLGPRLFEIRSPSPSAPRDEKTIQVQGRITEQEGDSTPLPKLLLVTGEKTYELVGGKNIELLNFVDQTIKIKGIVGKDSDKEEKLEVLEYFPIKSGPEEHLAKLNGIVQPSIVGLEGKGTHTLTTENGQILAYLKTDDDKLKISEGAHVQIEGKIIEESSNQPPLIQVIRIVFK